MRTSVLDAVIRFLYLILSIHILYSHTITTATTKESKNKLSFFTSVLSLLLYYFSFYPIRPLLFQTSICRLMKSPEVIVAHTHMVDIGTCVHGGSVLE